MYPYHNRIKQRIKAGDMVDVYFTDSYPKIGKAMVLVFDAEPFKRPIRPRRWDEYKEMLLTMK